MRTFIFMCVVFSCGLLHAEAKRSLELNEIPVTANPLNLSSDEIVRPIHIMNGVELQNKKSSSLGSMLDSVPGVSNNSWGDNVGRPVIRGMDRNRVQILNNGMQLKDVSNLSGDHATSLDALSSEQIEVVMGPETIMYGGGAVGGVINIIDHRIHPEFVDGIVGKYDVSIGGPNNGTSSSMLVDIGADNFMWHFDLYDRDSKSIKIPGFSVSKKLAESDSEFTRSKYGKDSLQNSYNETLGGGVGATYFFDNGHTGFSYAKHEQEYGTILENDAFIDLESDNVKYELEMRDLSNFVNKFKFNVSHTDYEHFEMEGPTEIGLDFFDRGTDVKVEIIHSLLSKSGGAVGLNFGSSKFSQNTKPYAPNNKRQNVGLYALEGIAVGSHKFTVGFRHDYHDYEANAFTSDDGAPTEGGDEGSTSFAATEKSFHATSFSVGSTSKINDKWTLAFNVAHSERAPNHDELFVYGEHHATETIEHGDRTLSDERSNSAEVTLSWADQGNAFSISPYFMDFSSYIALLDTGVVQYHEHDGEEEALPVLLHQNIPADFYGFEFQGNINLAGNYGFNYWGDYVRAKNKNGGDLPRIPPLTLGSGLSYQVNALQASINVEHNFSQTNIGPQELKTDSYTNLSLIMNYDLPYMQGVNAFIKGENLLDEERRDHASYLKDKVLMGQRSIMVGITGYF
ncbi:MAG: TonB-dependent receptor [Methylophilaceae bacterium]|nr:TonB-dependent receptor [Methylophilaceae bacterium]